jgi:drug/metabolite transporter (DMT)-like permease
MPFLGEFAALSAALIWAIASLVYVQVGQQISPLVLNFTKGWIALMLLGAMLGIGQILNPSFAPLPTVSLAVWLLLGLSGIVGIGLGDTAYFRALNAIGSRQTLLIETLAPAIAALLAAAVLGEPLGVRSGLGMGLILVGIVVVILERTEPVLGTALGSQKHYRGIGYATLAALCQASGSVLSRRALINNDMDPLWSTIARLLGGVLVMLIWMGAQQQVRSVTKPLRTGSNEWPVWITISLTALFSTCLGILLQQVSLKYATTGVAQALSSTSPLFVLPLAALGGDRLTLRAVMGAIVAIIGVGLLFQA